MPESLVAPLDALTAAYHALRTSKDFWQEYLHFAKEFANRPTPLYLAERLTRHYRRARIYLKREDLNFTGSHKLNNCLGQILVAKTMGKRRIIAETGAGQHGVATATVCARFGLECVVYMGAEDVRRQALNVFRMKLLGAEVVPVETGSRTLKDAINETMRDWVARTNDTHYLVGSVVGPHPYPMMVRDFQSIIGLEVRRQIQELEGRLPDYLVACVGGGSNAMGLFYPFLQDQDVQMLGVEAGGLDLSPGHHSASLGKGSPGVLHGARTYLLQTEDGQVLSSHSVAAGLDYPAVGPEHSALKASGRATYVTVLDHEAVAAFQRLGRLEGILPALESSHALAYLERLLPKTSPSDLVVVNLSGRGDKDAAEVEEWLTRHSGRNGRGKHR